MTTLKDMALQYAEDGLFVFPLKAGTKTPAVTGYRALKWGAAEIERWWSRHPKDNIGISLDLNGLVCVDADIYKPECEWDRGEDIATAMVRTARGGLHFYFSAPSDHDFRGTYGKGVDIKHKGFSALPPSRFDGGTYEWDNELPFEDAPEWLLAMTKASKATSGGGGLMSMLEAMDVEAAMVSGRGDEAYQYIDVIDSATNPAGLDREGYWAVVSGMADHYKGTSLEQEAYDATAAWAESWEGGKDVAKLRSDFDRDWNSVRKGGGIKIASTMHILKKAGAITLPATGEKPKATMTAEEKSGFFQPSHLRPVADRRPRDFLLGKHIRRGFISITSAAGGVGKSSLLLREIVSMVTGTKYTHEDVYYPSLKVMMISEDPMADEMEHRLAALVEVDLGLDWSQYEAQFQIGRLSAKTRLFEDVNGVVTPTDFYHMLAETSMDVLVIDPLGGVLGLEEDSNTSISAAMTLLADLAQKVGCGVEIVHHSTKEGRKAQNGEDINSAIRGAGALSDRVRSARTIRNMTAKEAEAFGIEDKNDYIAPFYGKTNNAKLGLGGWYVKEIIQNPNVRDGVHQGVSDPVVKPMHLKSRDTDHELTNDLPKVASALLHASQEEMRISVQADGWIGIKVGDALGLDVGNGVKKEDLAPSQTEARARVKRIIDALLGTRVLTELDPSNIIPTSKGKRPPTYHYNGVRGEEAPLPAKNEVGGADEKSQ